MEDFQVGDIVKFIDDRYNLTCRKRKAVAVVKEVCERGCSVQLVAMENEGHYWRLMQSADKGTYYVDKTSMDLYEGEYDYVPTVKSLIEGNTDYYEKIIEVKRKKIKNKEYNINSFLLGGF